MKQPLIVLRNRIDALSLRERAMLFLGAAALMVFLGCHYFFNPMFARQAALRAQLSQQQTLIAGIEAEITQKVLAHAQDPDAAINARIAATRRDAGVLGEQLRTMRSSLVAPEAMAPLLENVLKVNGKLKLERLATLAPEAPSAGAGKTPPLFYRHGVQITVSGNYPDMVAWMAALESLPTQVFWGSARFEADAWPQATLTLTVYTLSLDPTWMSI